MSEKSMVPKLLYGISIIGMIILIVSAGCVANGYYSHIMFIIEIISSHLVITPMVSALLLLYEESTRSKDEACKNAH